MLNNNKSIKELTALTPPAEFKDWLNQIQAYMIETGYCNELSSKGAAEFAGNFLHLQNFFSAINHKGK